MKNFFFYFENNGVIGNFNLRVNGVECVRREGIDFKLLEVEYMIKNFRY